MRQLVVVVVVLFVTGACADQGASIRLDTEQLKQALLTPNDLRGDWTTIDDTEPDTEDESGPTPCDKEIADYKDEAEAEATVSFEKGPLDQLQHTLAVLADSSTASDYVEIGRDLFDECPTWSESDEEATVTIDAAPLPLTSYGDDTLAIRMTISGETRADAGPVQLHGVGDFVLMRYENVLALLVRLAFGTTQPEIDAAELDSIAKTADARLRAAL